MPATIKDELEELLSRVQDGSGYGDPDARLNDDRKVQILLAKQQAKTASQLNLLTLLMVVVGVLNVVAILVQTFKK